MTSIERLTAFLSLMAVVGIAFLLPSAVFAQTSPGGGVPVPGAPAPADPVSPVDPGVSPTDPTTTSADESGLEKIGNFVSDNATWFILGVIVLAAIIAGILILRGRRRGATPAGGPSVQGVNPTIPPGKAAAAGAAAAAAPSASEIKRRRRAAMQRAREEERLRRKSGGSAPASPGTPPADPVAAEKEAARRAAGAPVPAQAPVAPTPPPQAQEAVTEVSGPATSQPMSGAGATAPGVAATAGAAATAAGIAAATGTDAEQRLEEKVAEIKAGQAAAGQSPVDSTGQPVAAARPEAPKAPPVPDQPLPAVELPADLAEAESRIRSSREARDRTLTEAEDRLHLLEERALAAERRAAFAEQMVELKVEEGEHERRLQEVVQRIARAEDRARQAEIRAEAAERAASDALRGMPPAPGSGSARPGPAEGIAAPEITGRPEVTDTPSPPPGPAVSVNINTASFEELREADLSVTQATRVLAYRERFGGYESVEDLAKVPGFTEEMVAGLQTRLQA
jgi:competence ComEA-like helix-hairpin-helix protein